MTHCIFITDNKIGNINPAKGLATALLDNYHLKMPMRHYEISTTHFLEYIPLWVCQKCIYLTAFILRFFLPTDFFENPLPKIMIGNGRASVRVCALVKIYANTLSHPLLSIQLQNPRIASDYFDVIIAPEHDALKGANIIRTIGLPTHIHPNMIEKTPLMPAIERLKSPIISVFIGGKSKRYDFSEQEMQKLIKDLKYFIKIHHCSFCITTSRRTDPRYLTLLQENFANHPDVYIWDGQGENPYFSMLKASKMAIVTADSANMLCEIATAGVPLLLYPLSGNAGKFKKLYTSLKKQKLLQLFSYHPKKLMVFPKKSFNETGRVVRLLHPYMKKYFN